MTSTGKGAGNQTKGTEFMGAQVPADVAEAVRDLAKRADRSLSAEIRTALREYVQKTGATA